MLASSLYLYSKAPLKFRLAFQSFWTLFFQTCHHHYRNEETEGQEAGCFLLLHVRGMKAMG